MPGRLQSAPHPQLSTIREQRSYPCVLEGLGEESPLRVHEAQGCMNGDLGAIGDFEDGVDLTGKSCDELGLVTPVDVEAAVGLEPATYISLFNLALVVLGVDDPDP